MAADATLLADLPLFASLGSEEIALLSQAVDLRSLDAGQILFKAGDPGEAMYIVVSGEMEICVVDRAGQKIVLTGRHRGDVFGELAMLDTGTRTATATALVDTELLELDRSDLLLLVTQKPEAALHLLGAMGAMTRKADLLLRTRVARNVQDEIEDQRSLLEKITDWIANFSGSMTFLLLNAGWFALWIFVNVSGKASFDPYPFGFLTMVVSLEAIILSILVLLAQNRQAAKDHIRDDVEYEINVKAELEIAHLHEKVEELTEQFRDRLDRMETMLTRPTER
jgi:CRP/FNR family transcriptional regulator, cyclic AMP receptor protein